MHSFFHLNWFEILERSCFLIFCSCNLRRAFTNLPKIQEESGLDLVSTRCEATTSCRLFRANPQCKHHHLTWTVPNIPSHLGCWVGNAWRDHWRSKQHSPRGWQPFSISRFLFALFACKGHQIETHRVGSFRAPLLPDHRLCRLTHFQPDPAQLVNGIERKAKGAKMTISGEIEWMTVLRSSVEWALVLCWFSLAFRLFLESFLL